MDGYKPDRYRVRSLFILARLIAAGFAFYAIGKHSLDYYAATRWVVFLTCCWGVWMWRTSFFGDYGLFFAVIAVVFNPIFHLHMNRELWIISDIAAGILLVFSCKYTWPGDIKPGDN